jgi:hypothetical protein
MMIVCPLLLIPGRASRHNARALPYKEYNSSILKFSLEYVSRL